MEKEIGESIINIGARERDMIELSNDFKGYNNRNYNRIIHILLIC